MDIHALTAELFQTVRSNQNRPLTLRPGEIFFAQVQKIFPNQHAEIQLGAHKLIARLEAPLESGKGYFLQVEPGQGEPRLKLIGTKQTDSLATMRQLSIPNEKGFHVLAEFLTKEPISLTREQIHLAGQWVGDAADKDLALRVVQLMSSRDMPFSESIYKSLIAALSKTPMAEIIASLRAALILEGNSEPAVQRILDLINTLGKDSGQNSSTNEQNTRLGKKVSQTEKGQTVLNKEASRKGTNIDPAALRGNEASQKSSTIESHVFQGKDALTRIKQSIRQMGLFSEHAIIHNRDVNGAETLKSLLIQYLSRLDVKTNHIARHAAEQLLHRMDGQQLLSVDSGPVQQIFFDLPIDLYGHRTDLTMQWEGKRREDGKIDPDYCRIMFYLDLVNLDKTVVDVKIQNRITNITVINESSEIKAIAGVLIPNLKKRLKDLDYELSSVHFKQPARQKMKKWQDIGSKPYSGVDIQI
ncbi:hypothetical protein D4T97_009545 [Siminovitchia acidinfaciens]|uniref:Flagellar hook-length control protein FliK n=1 Tax=Siminovitchia acidinfaciens TaxID=2321395 RepID=A0A429Y2J8_9BACI|nr:hypothetical protein [Siminovitchia acidinfaciens]RST75472.1 hypothetical protein D4T97_009545 [Siminovitchia acidinfaciens]